MSLDFLNEAFNRLRKLDEDAFDMSDLGIHELGDFRLQDENTDLTPVIDSDAQTQDELDKTYINQVILECPICHSNIFKKVEDVILTSDPNSLANPEEACPFCGEDGGFLIVGQVKKFDPQHQEDETVPAEEVNSEVVNDEEMSIQETSEKTPEEIVEDYDQIKTEIIEKLKNHGYDLNNENGLSYIKAAVEYLKTVQKYDPEYTVDRWIEDTVSNYPEDLIEFKAVAEGLHFPKIAKIDEDLDDIHIDIEDGELEVETDEKKISVEDGKTVIKDKCPECEQDEVIAPVSDELEQEIINNNAEEEPETEEVSEESETEAAEDDAEEADEVDIDFTDSTEDDEKNEEEDDDMQDIEIDEIQEESFNIIGNKLLQNIYENVDRFEMTKASTSSNQLKLEGLITFKSGKTKPTQFIFEAKDISKTGRLRFLGENAHISSAKKPFMITGYLKDNKYIVESLNYNFSAKRADGTPIKLQGTVSAKR